MIPSEIELQIDELVLHGFAAGDRRRIGQAMERELHRLLAESAAGGATFHARTADAAVVFGDGGTVHLAAGASPEVAGVQVARAVYQALGRDGGLSLTPGPAVQAHDGGAAPRPPAPDGGSAPRPPARGGRP